MDREQPLVAHGNYVYRGERIVAVVMHLGIGSEEEAERLARLMAASERLYGIVSDSLRQPDLVTPERLRACLDGIEGPRRKSTERGGES